MQGSVWRPPAWPQSPEPYSMLPQKLAFQYLEELVSEFSRLYGPQIDSVARPYAFIKFGVRHRAHPPPCRV